MPTREPSHAGRGDRFAFSNFEVVEGLELDGMPYPTAEHLFQALKTDDLAWRERVRTAKTPATAKRLGRRVPLREYWDDVKLTVMRTVLRRKFALEPFRSRLLAWDGPIVETNTWHDQTWGDCVCGKPRCRNAGRNLLGRLLEEIRAELQDETPDQEHPGTSREASHGA